MKLLITDDEVIAVKAIVSGVNWSSCKVDEVFVAHSVKQAKTVFSEHEIDLLLCDIEMPQDNGLNLFKWVRENYPLVECAFLTCHADFKYVREALQLGSFDYLLKPVHSENIEELVIKMRDRWMEKKRQMDLAEYGQKLIQHRAIDIEKKEGIKKTITQIVNELENYIMDNINDHELSVENLAQRMYMNPDYLNRIFKKQRGISLMKYIIKERMELAGRLLIETRASAHAIALEVGYTNYPKFVDMFKKIYGVSPSDYKKSMDSSTF